MHKSRTLTEISTKRTKIIKRLKEEAKKDDEILALYERIKLDCGEVFINYPDRASKHQVKNYNLLIQNSGLLISVRQRFIMD